MHRPPTRRHLAVSRGGGSLLNLLNLNLGSILFQVSVPHGRNEAPIRGRFSVRFQCPTGRIRSSQNETGPHGMYQGPAGQIRAPQYELGILGRTRALKEETGHCGTSQDPSGRIKPCGTNQGSTWRIMARGTDQGSRNEPESARQSRTQKDKSGFRGTNQGSVGPTRAHRTNQSLALLAGRIRSPHDVGRSEKNGSRPHVTKQNPERRSRTPGTSQAPQNELNLAPLRSG